MKVWIRVGLLFVGIVGVALAIAVAAAGQDPPEVLPTVVDDPSRPSIVVNGVRLHAEVRGDPESPVIVVLHGGPGDDFRALLPLVPLAAPRSTSSSAPSVFRALILAELGFLTEPTSRAFLDAVQPGPAEARRPRPRGVVGASQPARPRPDAHARADWSC